jgi:glycosyltransferase involved in cell wall biosynthesis
MFISVVLATRNRAGALRRTLESIFTASNLASPDWEAVVIDNGSTDGTVGVCGEFKERSADHFVSLVEIKPGKSNALNTGFRASRGDIIALIDDDVICQDDYLNQIRKVFASGFSGVVQGRVFVDYLGKRPDWFDEYFDQMMLLNDLGEERCALKRSLWGVNAALPAAAIEKAGGFCLELGAGAIGFGEDAEFDHRLRRAGYRVFYTPEIVVRHQVSTERLSIRYVLERSYQIGRCGAYYDPPPPVPLPRFTAYVTKEFMLALPIVVVDLAFGRRGKAARRLGEELKRVGNVVQHWIFKFQGRPALTVPPIEFARR